MERFNGVKCSLNPRLLGLARSARLNPTVAFVHRSDGVANN